jgi:hypothetical protein
LYLKPKTLPIKLKTFLNEQFYDDFIFHPIKVEDCIHFYLKENEGFQFEINLKLNQLKLEFQKEGKKFIDPLHKNLPANFQLLKHGKGYSLRVKLNTPSIFQKEKEYFQYIKEEINILIKLIDFIV